MDDAAHRPMRPLPALVGAVLAVSWIGQMLHNVLSLPDLPFLSVETLGPGVVAAVLFVGYAAGLRAAWMGTVLLGWGLLNLTVGAVLTVLPLPFLPFDPEQTLEHYSAHALYGLLQLPLLWVALRIMRAHR